jgi:uncharacterized protein
MMQDLGAALRIMAQQHAPRGAELLETHISWVLLDGKFAWKFKKPVVLEFVDFSTIQRREHFCHEELRLNRRLAPELYLDVVPVAGTTQAPVLEGPGAPIDFAVKMRRFPQEQLLSVVLERGELTAEHIDGLAETVADFHQRIDVAGAENAFGSPEAVAAPIRENFEYLAQHLTDPDRRAVLQSLQAQTDRRWEALADRCEERHQSGFVRECHGDMHLGNMVLLEDRVRIFDAIDFNPGFRWIDVMNEAAFAVMDLQRRGRKDFAYRFLNRYCELTGDYSGMRLLRFYVAYRALVRAKVRLIRLEQHIAGTEDAAAQQHEFDRLVELAAAATERVAPLLMITCGLSGCGKTTMTQALLERIGAIRIRSDVERQRMAARGELAGDTYSSTASEQTYDHLEHLAAELLDSGLPVIVDATFLRRNDRERFERLAHRRRARFVMLVLHAPAEVLRSRIEQRQRAGSDASDADVAVLQQQIASHEMPADEQNPAHITLDATQGPAALVEAICTRLPPFRP